MWFKGQVSSNKTREHGQTCGFVRGEVYDSIRYPKNIGYYRMLRCPKNVLGQWSMHKVCTRPFLLSSKGLGTRLTATIPCHNVLNMVFPIHLLQKQVVPNKHYICTIQLVILNTSTGLPPSVWHCHH